MLRVGIIGAGHIASKMAGTIKKLEDFQNYAIASRSMDKAIKYQQEFGFQKAYDSYLELVEDENVDLVYIATPHSLHYEQMLLCLQHHKPVLCEKILTTDYELTKDIYAKFAAENILLTEALWSSFLPSRQLINRLLYRDKVIGTVFKMEASFKKPLMHKERLIKKSLGGGSMMDIGIYPLTMIFRTLGFNYLDVKVKEIAFSEEVDIKETLVVEYRDKQGICYVDGTEGDDLSFTVYGDKGYMLVDMVTCPQIIKVFDISNKLVKEINCEVKYGGFEYELAAVKKALEEKKISCSEWNSEDSISLSKLVTKIINQA